MLKMAIKLYYYKHVIEHVPGHTAQGHKAVPQQSTQLYRSHKGIKSSRITSQVRTALSASYVHSHNKLCTTEKLVKYQDRAYFV